MKEVEELREEIAKLTGGELPESTNAKHLSERLADLRKITTVSFQMPKAAHAAAMRVAKAETPKRNGTPNLSKLIRDALVEYARKRGHDADAVVLEVLS